MRRPPDIRLEPLVGAVSAAHDDIGNTILDAAATVLMQGGLRRCTVEEIAERARVGRTTVYRRFDGRDAIVHAVLAREVQRAFVAIAAAVAHLDRPRDRVVDGILAGLRTAEASPLMPLVRSEPELLRLVTVEAAPLIAVAVDFLVAEDERTTGRTRPGGALVAEMLVRLATSLAITPDGHFPLNDEPAARRALHALLDPLLDA